MDYSMDDKITISRRERYMNTDENLLILIDAKLAFTTKHSTVDYVIMDNSRINPLLCTNVVPDTDVTPKAA
jgi:hypothetical protein